MTGEEQFYSPSFIIAREQATLVSQLSNVIAAAELFAEYKDGVGEGRAAEGAVFEYDPLDRQQIAARMNVAARAFVHEAALLRALAVDVGRRFPQFAAGVASGLAAFDAALPQLLLLRHSLAHYDERLNFRARNKALRPARHGGIDPEGFGAFAPPQVCGSTIQGTVETGEHAVIPITTDSLDAAEGLVKATFSAMRPAPSGAG